MSGRAGSDLLTLPRAEGLVKELPEEDAYLSSVSPRHKPWDTHRGDSNPRLRLKARKQGVGVREFLRFATL
jgi:hypothetical protein